MRSEQDFQQELAERQWDYEKFNRAKVWEIDKMEIRSRLDFEKEEKKRAEKMEQGTIGLESIRKAKEAGQITGNETYIKEREQYFTDLEAGVYSPPVGLYQQGKASALSFLGGAPIQEPAKGVEIVVNPVTKEPIYIPENQPFVNVQHPTLGLKKIRREQLQEALAEGAIYIPTQPKAGVRGTPGLRTLGMMGGV